MGDYAWTWKGKYSELFHLYCNKDRRILVCLSYHLCKFLLYCWSKWAPYLPWDALPRSWMLLPWTEVIILPDFSNLCIFMFPCGKMKISKSIWGSPHFLDKHTEYLAVYLRQLNVSYWQKTVWWGGETIWEILYSFSCATVAVLQNISETDTWCNCKRLFIHICILHMYLD